MGVKKYLPGNRIGPNNILFVKELDERGSNGRRVGFFKCPVCGREDWKNTVDKIVSGSFRCPDCYKKHTRNLLIERNKKKTKDLRGQKINKLTVVCLNKMKTKEKGHNYWSCLCDCGNTTVVSTEDLLKKKHPTKSCGCARKLSNSKDLTNKKFGKLTAICPTEERKYGAVIWKCECDCGNIHYTSSDCLLNGKVASCGCDTTSKGEKLIEKILKELSINYCMEKTFLDCKNPQTNMLLRFDFYLPDYNCCIEYDGIQHFKETSWRHESLESVKRRDNIKNEYCKNHNIKLIRIPYWDYDKIDKNYINSII